jgi:hypothetical protein
VVILGIKPQIPQQIIVILAGNSQSFILQFSVFTYFVQNSAVNFLQGSGIRIINPVLASIFKKIESKQINLRPEALKLDEFILAEI